MNDKYLIACLRYDSGNFLLLWGPKRNGYTTNLNGAGVYTKEEALKICSSIHFQDVPVSLEWLGISENDINSKVSDHIWKTIYKSDAVYRHIKQQKMKFKLLEKHRKTA